MPPANAATRVACSWCCSTRLRPSTVHARLAICESCGVASTYLPPTNEELRHAYTGWYRPEGGRFSGPGDAFLRRSRAVLARRLDRIVPRGRVLDVGSGDGALLAALRARGREAEGIEPGRPGECRFGDIGEVSGTWSGVVFWHSLEHLTRPAEALERVRDLLAPGGLLVIAAPNADSLQARAFGDRWLALDIPRHIVHLSQRAVVDRLEELGLQIEHVSALRGGQSVFGWLHGLVGLFPGTVDLYDAIRRPAARKRRVDARRRATTLVAAVLLLPMALLTAVGEAALGHGGSVYVEARRV